jgi:hypothetical protein
LKYGIPSIKLIMNKGFLIRALLCAKILLRNCCLFQLSVVIRPERTCAPVQGCLFQRYTTMSFKWNI